MNWRELSGGKKTTYTIVAVAAVAGIIYLLNRDKSTAISSASVGGVDANTFTTNNTNSTVVQDNQLLPTGSQTTTAPTTQVTPQDFQIPVTRVGLGVGEDSFFDNSLKNTANVGNFNDQTGESFFQRTFGFNGKQTA